MGVVHTAITLLGHFPLFIITVISKGRKLIQIDGSKISDGGSCHADLDGSNARSTGNVNHKHNDVFRGINVTV